MPNSKSTTVTPSTPCKVRKPRAPHAVPYEYRPKPERTVENSTEGKDSAAVSHVSPAWDDATKECSLEDRARWYNTMTILKVTEAMTRALDQLTLAQATNIPAVSEAITDGMEAHKQELTKTIDERPNWNALLQLPPDQHPSSFNISAWAHPETASYCPDSVAILLKAVPVGSEQQVGPLLCFHVIITSDLKDSQFQRCNSILATAQLRYDQSQRYVSWVTVNTGPARWTEQGMDQFWLSRVGVPPQTYSSKSDIQ